MVGGGRRNAHRQRRAVHALAARPREGDGRALRVDRHGRGAIARPLRRRRRIAARHRHSGEEGQVPGVAGGVRIGRRSGLRLYVSSVKGAAAIALV
jgi:hypothetical protein